MEATSIVPGGSSDSTEFLKSTKRCFSPTEMFTAQGKKIGHLPPSKYFAIDTLRNVFVETRFTEFACEVYGCRAVFNSRLAYESHYEKHQHVCVDCQYTLDFGCEERGCPAVFNCLRAFESHYNREHRHVCVECHYTSPSDHLLGIHIQEHHDFLGRAHRDDKSLYRCFIKECSILSPSHARRKEHLIKDHDYPSDYNFETQLESPENASMKTPSNRGFPPQICFGHGSVKSFKGQSEGEQYISTIKSDTKTDIEDINMTDMEMS